MTPSSLSLSRNGQTLYIACSDANAIAVADVFRQGKQESPDTSPTGWYPTTVPAPARRTPLPGPERQRQRFLNPNPNGPRSISSGPVTKKRPAHGVRSGHPDR